MNKNYNTYSFVYVVAGFALALLFAGAQPTTTQAKSSSTPVNDGACILVVDKTVDKPNAEVGDTVTYTINFRNTGADCPEGIKVHDDADTHAEFQSESHTSNINIGWKGSTVYNPATRVVKWSVGSFKAGDSGYVSWTAKIVGKSCTTFDVPNKAGVARIRGTDEANWTWYYTNTVTTHVSGNCNSTSPPPPNPCTLIVNKSVDKPSAEVGDMVTYTITFQNIGGDCVEGIKVHDDANTHAEFMSESHSSNISIGWKGSTVYNPSTRVVKWSTSFFHAGDSGYVTWTAKIVGASCTTFDVPNKAGVAMIKGSDEAKWTWFYTNTVTTHVAGNCNVPTFDGQCYVSPTVGKIGDVFTYVANATGGTGTYSYTWTGTDGLYGLSNSVSKSYTTAGTKQAYVTITSGLYSVTRTCSVTVNENPQIPNPHVSAYCNLYTPGFSVSWTSAGRGSQGYHVDIDNDNNWSNGGWYFVPNQNILYATGPTGFVPFGGTSGTLTLTPGQTYQVRIFYVASGEWSNTVTFNAENCGSSLSGSCGVTPTSGQINSTVFNWYANATGGTGSYTYSWSGSDSLSGNAQNIQKTYASSGTKQGTVVITSGTETISRTCSVDVTYVPPTCTYNCGGYSTLSGSCGVNPGSGQINSTVFNWYANATGGTGSYTYSWNGSDNLYGTGQNIQKTYGSSGSKQGTVVITSGAETITRTCSVDVTYVPPTCTYNCGGYSSLTASCGVTPNTGTAGNTLFTWYANATGGNGYYTYSWNGSENLGGYSSSVQKTYQYSGQKQGTVTVTSGNDSVTRTCSVDVSNVYINIHPLPPASGQIYLSQVPYTGIDSYPELVLFFIIVGAWSLAVAAFVVYRKTKGLSLIPIFGMGKKAVTAGSAMSLPVGQLPTYMSNMASVGEESTIESSLEQFARDNNALASLGAISRLVDVTASNEEKAKNIILAITGAESSSENWTTIDEKKIDAAVQFVQAIR